VSLLEHLAPFLCAPGVLEDIMVTRVPLATTAPESSRQLLTVAQAVELLSLAPATIYRLMASGQLVSVKVGKSRRIPARCLNAFVNAAIEEATANLPQPRHVAMRVHAGAPRRRAGASPHDDTGRVTSAKVRGQRDIDTSVPPSARPPKGGQQCDAER
jgi:excisionase family DNA binding protein